jgi:hypothetical protein
MYEDLSKQSGNIEWSCAGTISDGREEILLTFLEITSNVLEEIACGHTGAISDAVMAVVQLQFGTITVYKAVQKQWARLL